MNSVWAMPVDRQGTLGARHGSRMGAGWRVLCHGVTRPQGPAVPLEPPGAARTIHVARRVPGGGLRHHAGRLAAAGGGRDGEPTRLRL